jgi:glycine amidinotransferase
MSALGDTPHEAVRDEMWEDLAGFVALLEECGVTVRQPEVPAAPATIKTPDWEVEAGHCTMIRDTVLVIGDHLIETPPLVRSRYFENHVYQDLLYEYFHSGARWTVAPRPRMRETDFDYRRVVNEGWDEEVPEPLRPEIMFDAPQVLRLGRDLVFNCSTENHVLGAEWLERTVGDEYRVHRVETGYGDHLDCVVIALRPGTLLVHETLDATTLPPWLADWEMIRYRPTERDCARHGLPRSS